MRCGGAFDVEGKQKRARAIEEQSGAPDFWNDQKRAQGLLKEKSQLESGIREYDQTARVVDDAQAHLDLAIEAQDLHEVAEAEKSIRRAAEAVRALEFRRMLSGPQDNAGAIVEINAGAGGTESMDWAQMLLRMYTRFCQRRGWEVEEADLQPGDEAGIKSASFLVRGPFAFGFLKAENGVHRLVRMSPFDSAARRHTSFASVYVVPEIDDDIKVDIAEADVRIDTYRASGAGGQKVNKTSSAVRLTHIPTNTVVAVQNERSQHKNRDVAWKILRARLYDLEMKKRDAAKEKIEAGKADISFGSQIRSYVLAPYRLVKDLRTGVEVGNVDAVLDGDLDQFIEPYLMGVRRKDRPVAED